MITMNQKDVFEQVKMPVFGTSFVEKETSSDCLHMKCPMCKGTGVKEDGSVCVHGLSCPCKRCSPYC